MSVCSPLGLLEGGRGVKGWLYLREGEQPGRRAPGLVQIRELTMDLVPIQCLGGCLWIPREGYVHFVLGSSRLTF